MAWSKLQTPALELDFAGDLAKIIDKLKAFLEAQVKILQGILAIMQIAADPLAAALKALIDKLNSTIEGFLEDLGAYVLYVPVRKRLMTNFLGLGDITPDFGGMFSIFSEPKSSVQPNDPQLREFITNMNRYNGGNYGFCRTVFESLQDVGDINRPQFFDSTDYVGGVVLVIGTAFDPLGLLDDIWKVAGLLHIPDGVPKFPRPQNLKGKALSTLKTGRFSALLTWDAPDVPVFHLEDFGGTFYYPHRYAVLRGKNTLETLNTTNVVEWMGKQDISQGDKFANDAIEVIKEGEYNVSISSYLDEDIPAEESDSFYYTVAWKLKGYNNSETITEDNGVPTNYWHISNVVRLTPYPILPASTPPDWYRTPSIASLIPPFAELLRKLAAHIEVIANKLLNGVDMYKDYIAFLQQEILRYELLVNDILNSIAKLQNLLKLPSSGVYMRTFFGEGGNTYFVTDLVKGFTESDAPPFNKGDEFVSGAVIMAGGPELIVEGFLTAWSLLFGGGADPETTKMLAEVGEQVDVAETNTFGPDFTVTTASTDDIELSDDLTPISCKGPYTPPTQTFNPDFTKA